MEQFSIANMPILYGLKERSMFLEQGPPALFVHARHRSRTSTSNFGLIDRADKYMIELITKRCYQ